MDEGLEVEAQIAQKPAGESAKGQDSDPSFWAHVLSHHALWTPPGTGHGKHLSGLVKMKQ